MPRLAWRQESAWLSSVSSLRVEEKTGVWGPCWGKKARTLPEEERGTGSSENSAEAVLGEGYIVSQAESSIWYCFSHSQDTEVQCENKSAIILSYAL